MDLCDLVDVRGNRYGWLVAVDQHTDYTVMACPSHESQAVVKKWRTKRFCNIKWRVSVVSYEVVLALNQREGGWTFPSNTSVWTANEGPRRTGGRRGCFPFERGRRKRPTGTTCYHSGISATGLGKRCRLGSDQKSRYLGSAALMGPHIRSCWFDGRAYLCAAEHLSRIRRRGSLGYG